MATIRKRSKGWQVQIKKKINDQIIRESKTFPTKAEAQAWETMREAELMESDRKGVVVGNKYTLYDAFKKYLDEVAPKKKGSRREITAINRFIRELPFIGEYLSTIKPSYYAEYRDERLKKVKGSTVNRELAIISTVYKSAIKDWGWCSINPINNINKPKKGKNRNRLISDTEIETFINYLNYVEGEPPKTLKQEMAYCFLLAIETAMRQGELLGLTYDDIYLNKNFVRLDDSKNSDARDVPLSNRAIYLFEQLIKNNNKNGKLFKLHSKRAETILFEVKHRTGLLDLNFHDTRHEATTRLAKKLHVLELARATGHKNINELLTYYNETAENIASKLD